MVVSKGTCGSGTPLACSVLLLRETHGTTYAIFVRMARAALFVHDGMLIMRGRIKVNGKDSTICSSQQAVVTSTY